MSTARTCVSLPEDYYAAGLDRQRQLGYKSFSAYIEALIRADALTGGSHVREAAKPAPLPPARPVTYRLRRTKKGK